MMRFLWLSIVLRSIKRALWVRGYEKQERRMR